jgi:hypothetical protein
VVAVAVAELRLDDDLPAMLISSEDVGSKRADGHFAPDELQAHVETSSEHIEVGDQPGYEIGDLPRPQGLGLTGDLGQARSGSEVGFAAQRRAGGVIHGDQHP